MDHFVQDLGADPDYFVSFDVYEPTTHYYDVVSKLLPKTWRIKRDL